MHDTVIAKKIIEDAKRHGEVKSISVDIGEIAHITKEQLEPTLTSLVDWKVDLQEVKAQAKCSCGYEGPPKILERGHDFCVYECPECGNVPEITQGKDIVLKSVEVA